MPISTGDIKLVASKVMLDVPEGGGGPTANVIPSGVSNAIFPDISELDRTNGRVAARQIHVIVTTGDTDTYLGSNVIVSKPPSDPNVSITLFSTKETFDKRADAVARIEAYLSVGPAYNGVLFGNHIAGQRTILLLQKGNALPAIGDSMVLTKRAGASDQFVQYVRVTEASVSQRTFTDSNGDFDRYVATLTLSDALRADFPGFDATRIDVTKGALAAATGVSETIVADAARYYGVTTLEEAAVIGDFSIKGASIFTQLVPSAQVETPVADARANQVSAALIATGGAVSMSFVTIFDLTHSIYVGGGISPGSIVLSTFPPSFDVTDSVGRLFVGASQVGTVDYENGILSLASAIYGAGNNFGYNITYRPAAAPASITESQGFEITLANRSLSFVRTIEPVPVLGTLTVSYRAGGRWYVLRDDGSGAIRGQDSSFGAGTLNSSSGTISVTLGALPDVGSAVIVQWVSSKTSLSNAALDLGSNNKFYWPINSSGVVATAPGSIALTPNNVALSWIDGGAPKSANDNGAGGLVGDATGTVDYANGIVRLSPNSLPAVGTQVTLSVYGPNKVEFTVSAATAGAYKTFSLGGAVAPGSVLFTLQGNMTFTYGGGSPGDFGVFQADSFTDNGAGALIMNIGRTHLPVGTVNYSTGACQLNKTFDLTPDQRAEVLRFTTLYERVARTDVGLYQHTSAG